VRRSAAPTAYLLVQFRRVKLALGAGLVQHVSVLADYVYYAGGPLVLAII
jgi:hypothetical protein